MTIVNFLCCAFYQSGLPRALIVSQEVIRAVNRVRSQGWKRKQRRNLAALETHYHILHGNTPTAT